ncbi:hypothetical protein [Streptomyces sp. NPDC008001]|uniref:hypothetical protein n=1 Tax=Streptomyces sp. NPDC008001 TaxID=3364804 RepID=UPI0036EA304B
MRRTPSERVRREALADAASGRPSRIRVALYACIDDDREPLEVMTALRRCAEARDWVVVSAVYDAVSPTVARSDRKLWPVVENMLMARTVSGVLVQSDEELARGADEMHELREWVAQQSAFLLSTQVEGRAASATSDNRSPEALPAALSTFGYTRGGRTK